MFVQTAQTGSIYKPESEVPKSRPKGLGLKSHGPPTPPPSNF